MITLRPTSERGQFDHGWLTTAHSFSFGDYFHPEHMGFRALRVINEDHIAPGQGFGTHPHRDMEILTYVIAGALEHKDNLGNGSVIRAGDVQRMSAGTGVLHSEFNPSDTQECHLLQIWLMPETKGTEPSYEQKHFSDDQKRNRMCLIASAEGSEGSTMWGQNSFLYASRFTANHAEDWQLGPGRRGWLQVIDGTVRVNGTPAGPGDGLAVTNQKLLTFTADSECEFLFFDLA
jgi:quercetin 2,3-dioxygenase